MGSCFLFILLFLFGYSLGEHKLRFVTVLYRHGDRSPVSAFPTDENKESSWPQGFGQLSQEGMKQHFELGQFLRKRYSGFLSENYTRYEIFVRSSDFDRTLMSAASNLAGLYLLNGSQVFPGLDWQPIPIHTVSKNEEKLLSFPIENCPRYQELRKETETSDIFLNITKTYKTFMEMVLNHTGLNSSSFETMWSVYDTLNCERIHRKFRPAWATQDVMNTLKLLSDFSFEILFGVYEREKKCRLQGGLLLDQIIKNLLAAKDPNHQQKMIMYSSHDTTIVALQEALNVYNRLAPPYASCHITELYQDDNGSFSVSMLYRNSSEDGPYNLTLPNCAQLCPLDQFINLTKSVIPKDWHKECQIKSCPKDKDIVQMMERKLNAQMRTSLLKRNRHQSSEQCHLIRGRKNGLQCQIFNARGRRVECVTCSVLKVCSHGG